MIQEETVPSCGHVLFWLVFLLVLPVGRIREVQTSISLLQLLYNFINVPIGNFANSDVINQAKVFTLDL